MATKTGRPSLTNRVFLAQLLLATLTAIVVAGLSAFIAQQAIVQNARTELSHECELVEGLLDRSAQEDESSILASLDLVGVRVTLIDPAGDVLYDSLEPAATMENHAGRPEFEGALRDGEADSERASSTVGYVSLYHAALLDSGNVLRLSVERESVLAALVSDTTLLVALVAAVILLSWAIAHWLSRWLISPILAIDPSDPQASGDESTYEELVPMVERLEEQQTTLREQMEKIKSVSAIRQEFTANVTHELKTPLSSISGAAELIRDGIARPEDVPDFAARICDESAWLTSLVNDILTLSRLDESERSSDRSMVGAVERLDLLSLSRGVAERLVEVAAEAGVTITAGGEPAIVEGNARLLDELIYNLADNAIRYNHEGGTVRIEVGYRAKRPILRVSDTGQGIAAEDQPKVFERFYRVDKSRSRELGGTGLGLAIVKHAAAFHGADIDLASEIGQGTTFTVTFPELAEADEG